MEPQGVSDHSQVLSVRLIEGEWKGDGKEMMVFAVSYCNAVESLQ